MRRAPSKGMKYIIPIYFTLRGTTLIILLCGGDKRTQAADIARAKRLAEEEE